MANSEMNSNKHAFYARTALATLLALAFCAVLPSSMAQAKKRKKPNYGTIKIQSNPAGLLMQIDGKPAGQTTTEYTELDRPAGRIKCVTVNYQPGAPLAALPCPYPVKLSAPAQVSEGDVITYAADVSYKGKSELIYTWTVSPASAHIISGAGS